MNTTNQPSASRWLRASYRKCIYQQNKKNTIFLENSVDEHKLHTFSTRLVAVYNTQPLHVIDIETSPNSWNNIIFTVDFNAKQHFWNNESNNAAVNLLFQYLCSRHDTMVVVSNPSTYYSDNSHLTPDILNIALMKTKGTSYNIENLSSEISSDQMPLIINFQANATPICSPKQVTSTIWTQFELHIEN